MLPVCVQGALQAGAARVLHAAGTLLHADMQQQGRWPPGAQQQEGGGAAVTAIAWSGLHAQEPDRKSVV